MNYHIISNDILTTNNTYILSYSLNVLLLCNDLLWSQGSSSVALLKVSSPFFSPYETVFFYFLGVFPDLM